MVRRAGRIRVDAREAGPGPVSRLRGAYASGRDGVRELRGLCHRRGRRPAQPSLRARPGEGAETVRGRLPPHETAPGPGSEWGPREGGGRSAVHLHELRRLRRFGRREVPAVCRRVRGGAGTAGHGRGHLRPGPVPRMRRRQRPRARRVRDLWRHLRETKEPTPVAATTSPTKPQTTAPAPVHSVLDRVDEFLKELRPLFSEVPRAHSARPAATPTPSEATV